MKKFLSALTNPFVWVPIAVVAVVFLLFGGWSLLGPVFKSLGAKINNFLGNPDTDQGLGTFHANGLDATIHTIIPPNSSNKVEDRTRTDELKGLFNAAYGDRALSDAMDNPGGFVEFMLTGNDKYLQN